MSKTLLDAYFFFQQHGTSAWCVQHSSAVAVQNYQLSRELLCSLELISNDYITRFLSHAVVITSQQY